ncbi:hypothetical protein JTE90_014255 [Oedothorax gibbosus]|uniref:Uncharacterized protein n=1 Tax=Oedothorax gibbosus TaxID=931172 RepID=A0AAV6UAE8_9ARAC|nr:hypothetical protein JTE90_014255 [Oedothorax gibbosus]
MLKGGPRLSAQDTQRQKKRLSFKDPEIEGPQVGYRPPKGQSNLARGSLSLEDQAFHIAHNVGSAFSDLTLQEEGASGQDFFDSQSADLEDSKAEALIKDCFLTDTSYQRNPPKQSLRISAEDQEFLDDLSPPIPNMRGPTIEGNSINDHPKRNSIPSDEGPNLPSSAQHQIQLLKYQLEQQSQQTRLANHQVELLTDQVGAESAARIKAQEQNNQLMIQNQELLNHIERLFQQVEELEKQIKMYERSSKIPHIQEQQSTQYRPRPNYSGTRRLSGDATPEKPTLSTDHSNFATPRRGSYNSPKPNPVQQHKTGNPAPPKLSLSPPQQQNRRTPLAKPYAPSTIQQNRQQDSKGLLHIGDTSPPVQRSNSPFDSSGWRTKQSSEHLENVDSSWQAKQPSEVLEKSRARTGSFSSFSKLKPPSESINPTKNTSLGGGAVDSITNKKYSSSTSDLYSSTSSAYQPMKPLGIDDAASSSKTSISNVNVTASKLPRFQPYTGSGRRSSLTRDFEQFSAMGKDKFKTAPQTSFFNR